MHANGKLVIMLNCNFGPYILTKPQTGRPISNCSILVYIS